MSRKACASCRAPLSPIRFRVRSIEVSVYVRKESYDRATKHTKRVIRENQIIDYVYEMRKYLSGMM